MDGYFPSVAYTIQAGRQTIEIGRKEFLEANDRLSVQWRTEADPGRRREIIATLYQLDLRMFKVWRVFGQENRAEYEQEAFLWLTRALETFQPGKGAFVHWLKFYILKAQEEVSRAGRETAANTGAPAETLAADEEAAPDGLFWARVKKQCTDVEWYVLSGRLLEGLTNEEAARRAEVHPDRAKKLYQAVLQRIRIDTASQHLYDSAKNKSGNSAIFTDEPIWVEKKWLRNRLTLTPRFLKSCLNPNLPATECPWVIDAADFLPFMGGRIRYWETRERGLVFPQFKRRQRNPLGENKV